MTSEHQIQSAVRIELPWPHKDLSPNARVAWQVKHRRRRAYKLACEWACVAQKARTMRSGPVLASITFCPPDSRLRDLDNMLSSAKAAVDAVADVVGIDDHLWDMRPRVGAPVKGGAIIIELEAA